VCAELRQVTVAYGDVVDVRYFEREVVESGLGMVEAEEHVMIDVSIAAVAAIERADQIVLFTRVDVVRADETQHLAEPVDGLAEFRRHQHAVADPLDVPTAPWAAASARPRAAADLRRY